MKYLPLSEEKTAEILNFLNKSSLDDLFDHVPKEYLKKTSEFLDSPKSEFEIRRIITETIGDSYVFPTYKNFLGGNGHVHDIPAVIDPLVSRGEFLTAYTPYQPEVSQGTLQAIFEYQTMLSELMGTEVSNASLYDGSTATVEAILMACRIQRKYKVLVSEAFYKEYLETIETYAKYGSFEYHTFKINSLGQVDQSDLESKIDSSVAAIVVQSPNCFGVIEDLEAISKIAKSKQVLLIVSVLEAISLGLLEPPGSYADIVCGEGQSFGIPLNYGGPWLGLLGSKKEYIRNLPGRLVGMGEDICHNRAFAVTLSTREQHIRREKATSNICTNQGLMALRATIYLSVVGKYGLMEIAKRCYKLAYYAKQILKNEFEVKLVFPDSPFFNEILIQTRIPAQTVFDRILDSYGIAVGTIFGENFLLASFNETMTKSDIDLWKKALIVANK